MNIKNWLIKKLGGVPIEEYERDEAFWRDLFNKDTVTINSYQSKAHYYLDPVKYPNCDNADYQLWGLGEEVGELMGKWRRRMRGDYKINDDILLEAGDALFFLSEFCTQIGVSLGMIANMNLKKCEDRKKRGVVTGTGDNR